MGLGCEIRVLGLIYQGREDSDRHGKWALASYIRII
jgi:hypothetical protein